jgi:cytochrome c556
MKIKLAVAVLAFSFLALSTGHAEARKINKKDKKALKELAGHLDALSGILEKKPDDSKATLDGLEGYIKKNKKKILPLVEQIEKMDKELDADSKKKLEEEMKPSMEKFIGAVMGFAMQHQADASVMERFQKIMEEIQPKPAAGSGAKKK